METKPGLCAPNTFQEVFHEYAPELRNFLYARCGDISQAEDLTQEAFVRLWKNCAKVLRSKSRSFLYTVASNLFKDNLRHQQVVLRYKNATDSKVNRENPQYLLEMEEFKEQLQRTLAKMPEGSRVAFMMSRFEGLNYQQIADRLGISKKAVEKRMHRALLELKRLQTIRRES